MTSTCTYSLPLHALSKSPLTPLSNQDTWHALMCHSSPLQVFPLWSRCECCWLWWKVCTSCGCLRGASGSHQVSDREHSSQLHTQGQVKLKNTTVISCKFIYWNRSLFPIGRHILLIICNSTLYWCWQVGKHGFAGGYKMQSRTCCSAPHKIHRLQGNVMIVHQHQTP